MIFHILLCNFDLHGIWSAVALASGRLRKYCVYGPSVSRAYCSSSTRESMFAVLIDSIALPIVIKSWMLISQSKISKRLRTLYTLGGAKFWQDHRRCNIWFARGTESNFGKCEIHWVVNLLSEEGVCFYNNQLLGRKANSSNITKAILFWHRVTREMAPIKVSRNDFRLMWHRWSPKLSMEMASGTKNGKMCQDKCWGKFYCCINGERKIEFVPW